MKTTIISIALAIVFITFASLLSIPEDSYAKDVHISNVNWCHQVLKDHAEAKSDIPADLVSMCSKELGV